MIERKILIGLISSTEYIKQINPIFDIKYLESGTAKMIARWCIEFFNEYEKAPGKEIESIYIKKVQEGLDREIADEIENDILPDLSDEAVKETIDVTVLTSETFKHFQERQFLIHSEEITAILENGQGSKEERIKQVLELQANFKPITFSIDSSIDLSDPKSLKNFEKAFNEAGEPVVRFPKQLGKFWNHHFVPGAFVSFLATEKRGKTFQLLEIAIRAAKQGKKVAFFQAGDMNEAEQLKRIGIYLCRKSNLEKYCGEHYQPVRDCRLNQLNACENPDRECDFSPWEGAGDIDLNQVTIDQLKECYESNLDYKPCHNCKQYDNHKLGVVWLKKVPKVEPLEFIDVKKAVRKFFIQYKRRFKLSTHASGTLSVMDIFSILERWKNKDGFIPDVICIDYADLLVPSVKLEFRHQQNQIWKDLRKLSQTPSNGVLPLVICPTQADAAAYKKYILELDNFSEDKRKYGHVTAMFGLNQDPHDREKGLRLMRINEIIAREGEYSNSNQITVLQDLWQGRPFLGSYFQQ